MYKLLSSLWLKGLSMSNSWLLLWGVVCTLLTKSNSVHLSFALEWMVYSTVCLVDLMCCHPCLFPLPLGENESWKYEFSVLHKDAIWDIYLYICFVTQSTVCTYHSFAHDLPHALLAFVAALIFFSFSLFFSLLHQNKLYWLSGSKGEHYLGICSQSAEKIK